jgi:hypothetical protein
MAQHRQTKGRARISRLRGLLQQAVGAVTVVPTRRPEQQGLRTTNEVGFRGDLLSAAVDDPRCRCETERRQPARRKSDVRAHSLSSASAT